MIEIQNSKFSSFFKISFNSTNTSQNCQDSKFEQIFAELSRFKKSSSHFFDQIFTKSNYQDSKSFLSISSSIFTKLSKFKILLRSEISTKFSPLPLSLSLSLVQNFLKIVEKFTNSRKKKEWEENGERTRLQGVVPP